MTLLLNESEVRRVLPMDDLIRVMESAVAGFSAGEVRQPVRTVLPAGSSGGFFGVMPAFVPSPAALGAKLVTLFDSNTARGLPTHLATVVLLDPETGALIALMDGRYITEARTAAVSAVSARLLARPDAADLAIVGSGVQARSHLEALASIRPLSRIRVWSPTRTNLERFVASASGAGLVGVPIEAATGAREAVDGADLVVLATASGRPVVENGWIAGGAHIMCVGACLPNQREMDPALVARGRLFVDSRAAALVESGDIVLGIREGRFDASHIAGEIGELALGRVEGRRAAGDVTIFKSLGMAVEDVAAGELVYRRAREAGIGTEIRLD